MLLNGAPAIDVRPVRSTGYCARLVGSSCPWVFRRRIEALPASVDRETLARRSFLEGRPPQRRIRGEQHVGVAQLTWSTRWAPRRLRVAAEILPACPHEAAITALIAAAAPKMERGAVVKLGEVRQAEAETRPDTDQVSRTVHERRRRAAPALADACLLRNSARCSEGPWSDDMEHAHALDAFYLEHRGCGETRHYQRR